MKVLADTSILIELFNKNSSIDISALSQLIENDECLSCLPVQAEVLSGVIAEKNFSTVSDFFLAVDFIDLDWRSPVVWMEISNLAQECRRLRLPVPGTVDRMIFLSARESKVKIWTLDKKLKSLASHFHMNYK